MPLPQRGEPLDHLREHLEAPRGEHAERNLDPHHLPVGLALAVDAADQPVSRKVPVRLTRLKARKFGVELIDLLRYVGNDAGHVRSEGLEIERLDRRVTERVARIDSLIGGHAPAPAVNGSLSSSAGS